MGELGRKRIERWFGRSREKGEGKQNDGLGKKGKRWNKK